MIKFSFLLVFFLRLLLGISSEKQAVLADPQVAAWQAECERNEGLACGNLGALYFTGKGVAPDEAKAFGYYEKACQLGQGARCLRAGVLAVNGRGTALSVEKSADLFLKGCNLFELESCANYLLLTKGSRISMEGALRPLAIGQSPPKAEAKQLQAVVTALTLACNKAVAKACGNLGAVYEEGFGVSRDLKRALSLYERACELGESERCARAGRYYANGVGAERNSKKAEALLRRFCEGSHEIVCPLAEKAKLGMKIELNLDVASSPGPKPLAVTAEEQKTLSFREGGVIAEVSQPSPPPAWAQDQPEAPIEEKVEDPELRRLIESCNRGFGRACGNAGGLLLDESGKPKARPWLARRLFEKACALGRAQRCVDLARFHAQGWVGEKSPERERAALRRACELGHRASCKTN